MEVQHLKFRDDRNFYEYLDTITRNTIDPYNILKQSIYYHIEKTNQNGKFIINTLPGNTKRLNRNIRDILFELDPNSFKNNRNNYVPSEIKSYIPLIKDSIYHKLSKKFIYSAILKYKFKTLFGYGTRRICEFSDSDIEPLWFTNYGEKISIDYECINTEFDPISEFDISHIKKLDLVPIYVLDSEYPEIVFESVKTRLDSYYYLRHRFPNSTLYYHENKKYIIAKENNKILALISCLPRKEQNE